MQASNAYSSSRTVVQHEAPREPNVYVMRLRPSEERSQVASNDDLDDFVLVGEEALQESAMFQSQMLNLEEIHAGREQERFEENERAILDNYAHLFDVGRRIAPYAQRIATNPLDTTVSVSALVGGLSLLATGGLATPIVGAIAAGAGAIKLGKILSQKGPDTIMQRIESAIASAKILEEIQQDTLAGMANIDAQLEQALEIQAEIEKGRAEIAELLKNGSSELREEAAQLLATYDSLLESFQIAQRKLGTANITLGQGMETLSTLVGNQEELLALLKQNLSATPSPEEVASLIEQFVELASHGKENAQRALSSVSEGRQVVIDAQRQFHNILKELLANNKKVHTMVGRASERMEQASKLLAEQQLNAHLRQNLEGARQENSHNRQRIENGQRVVEHQRRQLDAAEQEAPIQFGMQSVVFGGGLGGLLGAFAGGGIGAGVGAPLGAAAWHNRGLGHGVLQQGIDLVRGHETQITSEGVVQGPGFTLTFNQSSSGLWNRMYARPSRTEGTIEFRIGNRTFSCPVNFARESAISDKDQHALIAVLTEVLKQHPESAQEILDLVNALETTLIDRRYPDEVTANTTIPEHPAEKLIKTNVLFANLVLNCEILLGKQ